MNVTKPWKTTDLVTFTEKILDAKLHFFMQFNDSSGYQQSFNAGPSIFELALNTILTLDVTRSSLNAGLCGKQCIQPGQSY